MTKELSTVEKLIEREQRAADERALTRGEIEFINEGGLVQVNFRLDRYHSFKLDKLAEKYDHSRSSMARELVIAALQDAWGAAGMPAMIEDSDLLNEYLELTKGDE